MAKLSNSEIENIEDLIPSIERMYKIKFENDYFSEVSNFNEFCDAIIRKIDLKNVDSCTTQQAFYKLKRVLIELSITNHYELTLETSLKELLPRRTRISLVKKIEHKLGFDINLLEPPKIITQILLYSSLVGLILLFIKWRFGLSAICICSMGWYLATKLGRELKSKTIRDLVEKITGENYLDVRTEKDTVNKAELKNVILNWSSEILDVEKEELKNASFV